MRIARLLLLHVQLAVPDLFEHLPAFVAANTELTWGSGCSGTDSPSWGLQAISIALLALFGMSPRFTHRFSAERDGRKRRFIRRFARPAYLFCDVFDLSREKPHDDLSDADVPQSVFASLWLFIAGFVCKTVSSLNADKHTRACALMDLSTVTGSTFYAVILFLRKHKPPAALLENVLGLLLCSQHLDVVVALRQAGYFTAWFNIDCFILGVPQRRARLYFLAVRRDLVEAAGMTEDAFIALCHRVMGAMQTPLPSIPLSRFLLANSHPYVRERHAAFLCEALERRSQYRRSELSDVPRWAYKHRDVHSHLSHSRYTADLVHVAPEYETLPDRVKDLLDESSVAFPDKRPLAISFSQSATSLTRDCVGVLTPKGRVWLCWLCRCLLGRESLALQCLPIDWDAEDAAVQEEFTDTFLHDLAGNAFNTASIVQMVVCILVVLANLRPADTNKRARLARPSVWAPAFADLFEE